MRLADLKRHLATPGATLTMTGYEMLVNGQFQHRPIRNPNPRQVAKLQLNSVALFDDSTKSGKSWLDFGLASDWKFEGNTAVCTPGQIRLTYTIGKI